MNQITKYIFSTVMLMMTVLTTSFGQEVMTLEACREQAVAYNKELKNAALQKQEAIANQETARTTYLPTLSGSITAMHMPGFDGNLSEGYFLPTANSEAEALAGNYSGESDVWSPGINLGIDNLTLIYGGLSIAQPIYTGGAIKYANKQADAGVDIAAYALNLTYSDVIENTDQAFWNVAMIEENIKTAEDYIKMLSELEDQMLAMYEVGLQPASEKLRVTVQKNEAELNLVKAKNGLKVAKMYLNQVLGQALTSDIQIDHQINEKVEWFSLTNGQSLARKKRNELKILQKQKEISEYDAKITQADYLPSVGIGVDYTNYYVDNILEEVDFQTSISAQVNIPIFSWGQGKKKKRAAQLRVQQAQIELENTHDLISLEVLQVQVEVEEAFKTIQIAQKNIEEATESLEETKASFEVGLNTTTDLLNAQASWQQAQDELTQAIARYKVLQTRWNRVTGNLYIAATE